jgi:hypothetical protein
MNEELLARAEAIISEAYVKVGHMGLSHKELIYVIQDVANRRVNKALITWMRDDEKKALAAKASK